MADERTRGPKTPNDDLVRLLEFIRDERGFDFSGYKPASLSRRFTKRMREVGIASYDEYLQYLRDHEDEFGVLFDTVLINVTSFFRDPEAWQFVASEIVPRILASKGGNAAIRIWSTGCASGEEPFTLAMVFAEVMGEDEFKDRVKIYATDADAEALNAGRHAVYSAKSVADVPEELRVKYFERVDHRYAFRKDLRRAIIFGGHDVINDPPISRVDLLSCRNTLMYFNVETQKKILGNFHFSLKDDGYVFLGKSEVLLAGTTLFTAVDLKRRVFAKIPTAQFRDRLLSMVQAEHRQRGIQEEKRAPEQAAFDAGPLAQIVVDRSGRVAALNTQARHVFGVTRDDIGRPIQDLELSYRPVELRSLIERLRAEGHTVTVREAEWQRAPDDVRFLDVQLTALLGHDGRENGTIVTFSDVTRYRDLQARVERSRLQLETAYEELQSTAEELETTNEELQSTNEELETTNEELQSANEELETMNEELQSTNEELETMNAEFVQRTDDVNQVNSFLESILASFSAGVIVLDPNLRVQGWSARAADLWGLPPEEALGEHFANLDSGLPVAEVLDDVRAGMADGAAPVHREVSAVTRRGREIECRVTITPLLGPRGDTRGAIVLTEEVDGSKDRGAS